MCVDSSLPAAPRILGAGLALEAVSLQEIVVKIVETEAREPSEVVWVRHEGLAEYVNRSEVAAGGVETVAS